MNDPGILVPIVSIVMVFAIPIVAIVGGLMYSHRRARLQQELLMKLAETGQPLPPEILNSALFQGANKATRHPLRGPLVVIADCSLGRWMTLRICSASPYQTVNRGISSNQQASGLRALLRKCY